MKIEKAEVVWKYYKSGKLRYEEYFIKGKRHNENGPAYKEWDKNGKLRFEEYWINGKKLNKEEFDNRDNSCNIDGKVIEIDGIKYELKEI